MKSILSLSIALTTAAITSADTTVTVIEYGPGGSVRRTSADYGASTTPAAAASFFKAMHTKTQRQHAGMTLVPDIFKHADGGVVVGISGAVGSMALDFLEDNVVGSFTTSGSTSDVMNRVKKSEVVSDGFDRRLTSTVEKAEGEMQVVSLTVNDESAAEAEKELKRMLSSLKAQAKENDKTYVVHLVVDTPSSRRRLEDAQEEEVEADDAVNQNADASSSYYGQKTMYEIQNFNVIAWTTVGLVVLVMYVMSHFIAMPLMPDTLLHAEAAKFGTD